MKTNKIDFMKLNKKGDSEIIALVMMVAIAIGLLAIVWNMTNPTFNKASELSDFEAGKKLMQAIDNKVQNILIQGVGAKESLSVSPENKRIVFDFDNNKIVMQLSVTKDFLASDYNKLTKNLRIARNKSDLNLSLDYNAIDLIGNNFEIQNGNYVLLIDYNGYSTKPKIRIRVQ